MGSPPSEPHHLPNETLHRRIIPRRFAIATKEVSTAAIRGVPQGAPGDRLGERPRVQPRPRGPGEQAKLVRRGGVLQLAERPGEAAAMLRAQRQGPVRRGHDDPGRRADPERISPAHRGRVGILLPRGDAHQPLLRNRPGTAEELRLVQSQRRTAWPGRAARCCPTTWDSSTCWATSTSGARTPTRSTTRARRRDRRSGQQAGSGSSRPTSQILRGGGFVDVPAHLRSAQRIWNFPHNRLGSYGFRIARTLP